MKKILIIAMLFTVIILHAEPVFIANPKVADSVLSKETLDGILKGRIKNWPKGRHITLVTLQNDNLNNSIFSVYAGMNPDQFSANWNRLVFTGKASQPKSFISEQEAVAYIAATDGALGYVDSASVTSSVKVIKID